MTTRSRYHIFPKAILKNAAVSRHDRDEIFRLLVVDADDRCAEP
jgi:hypothetical protein